MPFIYIHLAPIYNEDERMIKVDLLLSTELLKIISHAFTVALSWIAVVLDKRAGLELDLK